MISEGQIVLFKFPYTNQVAIVPGQSIGFAFRPFLTHLERGWNFFLPDQNNP
jgi:hypothetical protein